MVADLEGAGSENDCGESDENREREAAWCFHGVLSMIVLARSLVCLLLQLAQSNKRRSRAPAIPRAVVEALWAD